MNENSTNVFCMSSTVTVRMGCSSHDLQLFKYICVKPSKHCKNMLYPIGGCKSHEESEGKKLQPHLTEQAHTKQNKWSSTTVAHKWAFLPLTFSYNKTTIKPIYFPNHT